MSNAERIKRYRLKQKEQGRLKREMYLTDGEFSAVKLRLSELREHKQDIKIVITDVSKLRVEK
jgi:hypothetical protein